MHESRQRLASLLARCAEIVDTRDELLEEVTERDELCVVEALEELVEGAACVFREELLAAQTGAGGEHHDEASVVGIGPAFDEVEVLESFDRAAGGGSVDAQRRGEFVHARVPEADHRVERVVLAGVEDVLGAVEVVAEALAAGRPTQLAYEVRDTPCLGAHAVGDVDVAMG